MIEFLLTSLSKIIESYNLIQPLENLADLVDKIPWLTISKLASVLMLTQVCAGCLVLLNDRIFEYYGKRRVVTHHLKIKNDGNMASIFLLRTVDLPKTLAIRFRIGGNPMIWLSRVPDDDKVKTAAENKTGANDRKKDKNSVQEEKYEARSGQTLIPDLKNPMDTVSEATKKVSNVGKKAGFFASIFGSISSLLPKRVDFISDAQDSLKGFQQDTNTLVGSVNTKTNTVSSLGNQLSGLSGMGSLSDTAKSLGQTAENVKAAAPDPKSLTQTVGLTSPSNDMQYNGTEQESLLSRNFVYDEEVWQKNIGKVDDMEGSLNYSQSKLVQPGESLNIDVEIMNLSESTASVSHMYKIEVIQLPQQDLHLAPMVEYVNGIVIFKKVSQWERIFPPALVFIMVIVTIQILTLFTYLIF